ncbi:MAG: agmatinase [Candidatus Hydrogenedentota bacterium]
MNPLPKDENFLALPPEHSGPDSGVVILSCPLEHASSYGGGSAEGPQAIIGASHEVELYDCAIGQEPFRACGGIATLPALDVHGKDGAAVAELLRAETAHWLDKRKFVIVLGGEHSSIVGAVHAHHDRYPDLSVLQLDAHSDLRPEYQGTPWSHACAAARILDFCPNLTQVGIRSQDASELQVELDRGVATFYAHDIMEGERGSADWIAMVLDSLGANVYLTLDCDVFDPTLIPATGTPEPGGLSWQQVNDLLRAVCAERNLVGFDINELAPVPTLHHPQFAIAKLIYRIIGLKFPAK